MSTDSSPIPSSPPSIGNQRGGSHSFKIKGVAFATPLISIACDLGHLSQIFNLIIYNTEQRMIKSPDLQQPQFLLILFLLHSKFGKENVKSSRCVVARGLFSFEL